jgi:hypothetical protein
MNTPNNTPHTVLLLRGTMTQIMAMLEKAENLTLGELSALYEKARRN